MAPASCDAAAKGEHEGADRRRSFFSVLRVRGRKKMTWSRQSRPFAFADPTLGSRPAQFGPVRRRRVLALCISWILFLVIKSAHLPHSRSCNRSEAQPRSPRSRSRSRSRRRELTTAEPAPAGTRSALLCVPPLAGSTERARPAAGQLRARAHASLPRAQLRRDAAGAGVRRPRCSIQGQKPHPRYECYLTPPLRLSLL